MPLTDVTEVRTWVYKGANKRRTTSMISYVSQSSESMICTLYSQILIGEPAVSQLVSY
jgi:hypothetical protein